MIGKLALSAALAASSAVPAAASDVRLESPDGSISVVLEDGLDGRPTYRVERRGETILSPSPLGIEFAGAVPPTAVRLGRARLTKVDRTVPVIAGKTSLARDRYREAVVPLDGAGRPVVLTVRAYDDGMAFRYAVAGGPSPIAIAGERTGFDLPTDDRCWGLNLGRYTTSHEGSFDPFVASQARPYSLYDTGMLCRSASGRTSFLFAEADLNRYAGMYLRGRGDGGLGFEAALSPLPGVGQATGETPVAVRAAPGQSVTSPWRVVLMADRAGDLIASNTIGNLNPPATGDWSWVKPGKAAWDWWSGPFFPGQPPRPMNAADLRRLIDFAAASGLPYMLVDEGWALNSGVGGSAPKDTDITRSKPEVDVPGLARYAAGKGVGLMLWLQYRHLDARMDEALDQYVRWGIKGIKVDFMDRNDEAMVDFYHRVVTAAAKRRLLVDLHGAYAPTGLPRTYPNFVTQEGVMGAEYNKWSRRVTAEHNVDLAFTRLVLGPMDYTPGGFRNVRPADFRIVNSPPMVQTTRGQALAMYVVYDSPVAMVSDSPDAYARQPEFAFVRDVPTTWDETRFLDGDIGSHVVVARRKERTWYVGAMTNGEGRTVSLPLSFLGRGRFAAETWQDSDRPDAVVPGRSSVDARGTLVLRLAPSGGGVAVLRPAT